MSSKAVLDENVATKQAWEAFAASIGERSICGGVVDPVPGGELEIMGTGLSCSDLLPEVPDMLRRAEVVFYCLADAVTKVMIRRLRYDAIDLSIFYAPDKSRYDTYVQMAEAMLQPAREGRKVLSLYYGHPGIFAMPTHRAMAIARQEGIRARMRPGISALDYIIAELGFDPAYPGLLSYEATDLLLRHRRLDPSLHVVIWQIGVVGEMRQSRNEIETDSFNLLLDRIEEVYGDAQVQHYIGSRFPGFPSLIEERTISELRGVEGRRSITALSTMYIPPMQPSTNDRRAASIMRLENVDFAPNASPPQFDKVRYGPYEKSVINSLRDFKISPAYTAGVETPGVRLMLDLHDDVDLRLAFEANPVSVLSMPRYSDLRPDARRMLASRDVASAHHAMYIQASFTG